MSDHSGSSVSAEDEEEEVVVAALLLPFPREVKAAIASCPCVARYISVRNGSLRAPREEVYGVSAVRNDR